MLYIKCDYYQYFYHEYIFEKVPFYILDLQYYDSILLLDKPKVIASQQDNSGIFNIVDQAIDTEGESKVGILNKFDKKNKSLPSLADQELIKSKKNKIKSNKTRNRNDVVKKIINSGDDLFENDSSIRSNLKARKSTSKSKKRKIKNQNLTVETLSSLSQQIVTVNSSDKVLNDIIINKPLSIAELSLKIRIPEAEIITYLFLKKGISATVNEALDFSTCSTIASNYGFNVSKSNLLNTSVTKIVHESELSSFSITRSPIVTILGHVDHGKTTLLDSILKTSIATKERGGITQSIAAYQISHDYDDSRFNLVFLDTPGHESFTSMRLRGAKITDIALLVIAIDDTLKPQTVESIRYIKEMSLSCIVVITKCDKKSDNLQKIKEDLAENDLICEEWGGNVPIVIVSAIKGDNIDSLLSQVCLLAKSKNLHANPNELAYGTIIDAFIDTKKGLISTVLIQSGTLKIGDIIVSESLLGKVKSIETTDGNIIKSSTPSSIVKILCFSSIPNAGSSFIVFSNEKEAKKYCLNYSGTDISNSLLQSLNTRISFDNKKAKKQVNLIIKADTQGSLEAIVKLLSSISQIKVQLNLISASFGNITNSDVNLSIATQAYILAFNVIDLPQISNLIKQHQIKFKGFDIIYDLFEYVKSLMLTLVKPEYKEVLTGNVLVQTIFKMSKGLVAGCTVTDGKISSKSYIKVYRDNNIVYDGYVTSLKYMKNDIGEVLAPGECGLMSDFQEWQESDLIEAYEMILTEKVL
uniref:Translation initiation factor IF-2, chloroplastic n=1 Tax=Polysiphonia sertularioides TaxID=945028 RepID=A0A1Z1M941_9FLOR|nr:translation initiation factor 2 [Polysiphonia sertularioides]ARW62490.1 translation initiation factor 2 [Polysiphonia sertularioides]